MPQLLVSEINQNIVKAEYAVRGTVPLRAYELGVQLKEDPSSLPFKEIISCNIGNPQGLGQLPITFHREVLALAAAPHLLKVPAVANSFKPDVIRRAQDIIAQCPGGTGAYSHSKGLPYVRKQVVEFLEARDGYPANPEHIFLTDGASPGVQALLKMLIRDSKDGIMIPIPQYPLYSASIAMLGGSPVHYFLDEAKGWAMDEEELERSIKEAADKGINVRALCVIAPGNPTGQVLSVESMEGIVRFCDKHSLVLLADEVYQENIYAQGKSWVSFKKVLLDLKLKTELVSFHSVSKGFLGECGRRGGYYELTNVDEATIDQLYKLASVNLCPNLDGQLMVGLMVCPPKKGDESFEQYTSERDAIMDSLKRRATLATKMFNELEGITTQAVEGSMYAFPTILLPQKAVEAAKAAGFAPDTFYCLELINATGICVVNGSGFGQVGGTFHFRTTILPPENKFVNVMSMFKEFHEGFMKKYAD